MSAFPSYFEGIGEKFSLFSSSDNINHRMSVTFSFNIGAKLKTLNKHFITCVDRVTCRIPQSSINVLQNCIKLNTTRLFADYSRMTATNVSQSSEKLNNELTEEKLLCQDLLLILRSSSK